MAVPDSQNVYDVLGTVLYCTVPVSTTPDDQTSYDADDAQNIPLDYETALLLFEAEQASAFLNANATTATTTGAAGQRGKNGSAAAARSHGRLSMSTADGRLPPPGSSAAGPAAASLGASSVLPPPSSMQQQQHQQQSRVGFTNMSGRYGPGSGTTQRTGAGGASTSHTRKNSRAVGFDDKAGNVLESVAARNAHLAKAVFARGGSSVAARATQSTKRSFKGLAGASTTARTACMPRPEDRPLTVADAMEVLFPVQPAAVSDDTVGASAEAAPQDTRRASHPLDMLRKASSSLPSAAYERAEGQGGAADTSTTAASRPVFPPLWRRADVGHVSRLDVVLLYQHIQHRCATESARPRGVVCPNRERLYSDALQELTRQITLLCPERGLLLDELARSMQQSTETYDVLLDSASQYAVRKSTERDLHQHLFAEKAELETEVRRREHRVSEWRAKYAGLQKRFEEQQAADDKLHEQEIAYAKKANMQLVNEIKRLASEAEKDKES